MTIDDAIQTAEQFLEEYTLRDEYSTLTDKHGDEQEIGMVCQYVSQGNGAIDICFTFDGSPAIDEDTPEIVKLVDQAVNALKQAHPDVAKFSMNARAERG